MRKIILFVLIGMFGLALFACDKSDENDGRDCSDCENVTNFYYVDTTEYECIQLFNQDDNFVFEDSLGNKFQFLKTYYEIYLEGVGWGWSDCGGEGCTNDWQDIDENIYCDLICSDLDSIVWLSYFFEPTGFWTEISFGEADIELENYGSVLKDFIIINQKTFYNVYTNGNTNGDSLYYNNTFGVVGFKWEGEKYSLVVD